VSEIHWNEMGIFGKLVHHYDNKKAEFQSHMIEVEGMINNQTIVILID
jgi:hypothetical protein